MGYDIYNNPTLRVTEEEFSKAHTALSSNEAKKTGKMFIVNRSEVENYFTWIEQNRKVEKLREKLDWMKQEYAGQIQKATKDLNREEDILRRLKWEASLVKKG